MNTVTMSGWLQADPVIEHNRDRATCELRLSLEVPYTRDSILSITVTCYGHVAVRAVKRLAVGDHVWVTGWLRSRRLNADVGGAYQLVDVVGESFSLLGHSTAPDLTPDAHVEATYEDRYDEPDEVL